MNSKAGEFPLHLRIAESGKLFALNGDYCRALGCYRLAMHLAVRSGSPEVFFRHYLECLIEAMELNGDYEEVLAFCDRMQTLHDELEKAGELEQLDRANIHQRRGIVLLKRQHDREAEHELAEATRLSGNGLPLSATVLRWVRSRLSPGIPRLVEEQKRHGYFSVRRDTVKPALALPLGDRQIFGPLAANITAKPETP